MVMVEMNNTAANFTKGQTAYRLSYSFDQFAPNITACICALVIDSMGKSQGTAHRMESGKMIQERIYPNARLFANINEAIEVATEEANKHGVAHKERNIALHADWLATYGPNFKYPDAALSVRAKLESFQTNPVTIKIVYI